MLERTIRNMAPPFVLLTYMFIGSSASEATTCGSQVTRGHKTTAERCLLQLGVRSQQSVAADRERTTWMCPHDLGFKRGTDPQVCEAKQVCLTQIRDPTFGKYNSKVAVAVKRSKLYRLVLRDYMTATKASNKTVIPGTTLLVTMIHGLQFMRWDNIEHFAANIFPLMGQKILSKADRLLLSTVDQNSFIVEQHETDWFKDVLDIITQHPSGNRHHMSSMPLMFKLGKSEVCFEKLKLYSNPVWSVRGEQTKMFFNQPGQCKAFRERSLAFFGLPPPRTHVMNASNAGRQFLVTSLVRTDNQSYSNIVSVTERMRHFVHTHSGSFRAIWLPDDIMDDGKLSLRKQIQAVHNTDILITTHGAQLTNLVFMKPGARIVEIFKCQHSSGDFQGAAQGCNLKYYSARTTAPGLSHQFCRKKHGSRKFVNTIYDMKYKYDVKPVLATAIHDFFRDREGLF